MTGTGTIGHVPSTFVSPLLWSAGKGVSPPTKAPAAKGKAGKGKAAANAASQRGIQSFFAKKG